MSEIAGCANIFSPGRFGLLGGILGTDDWDGMYYMLELPNASQSFVRGRKSLSQQALSASCAAVHINLLHHFQRFALYIAFAAQNITRAETAIIPVLGSRHFLFHAPRRQAISLATLNAYHP